MYVTSILFLNPTLTLTSSPELYSNTLYNIVLTVGATASTYIPPIVVNVLIMLASSLLCCTMPRFIISVRELYDRDFRRHWQGIDSGFGALSRDVSTTKGLASSIAFADVAREESRTVLGDANDDMGAIPLAEVEADARRV